jgi:hypothetical protein
MHSFPFHLPIDIEANAMEPAARTTHCHRVTATLARINPMGRYLLLWLLGIPLPILLLIWVFGGLH